MGRLGSAGHGYSLRKFGAAILAAHPFNLAQLAQDIGISATAWARLIGHGFIVAVIHGAPLVDWEVDVDRNRLEAEPAFVALEFLGPIAWA